MSLLTDNASLMTYSIYAVYTLLTATVLLGCFLIIRKISQRQPSFEGDLEFDHERIARELDREIKDLENLRNRIFPASHFSKSSLIVQVPVSASGAVLNDDDILNSVEAQLSSQTVKADLPDLSEISQGTGASPEAMAAFQAKVNELTEALNKSKAELKTLRDSAASGGASGAADPAGGPTRAELDKLTKELELKVSQQKEEIQKHIGSVKHLEKIIGEYQLFEEDFALVKKYRKENEILRTELIKRGLSEPDIIKLLEAADALTPRTTKSVQVAATEETPAAAPVEAASIPAPEASTAPAAQSAQAPAPTPTPAPEAVSAPSAPAPAAVPAAAELASAPTPTPEAIATPTASVAAPVQSSDAQSAESVEKIQADAEAMAESVVSEDELMAEFEKLLNEKDQST
ncbi:MAG: hypothetical protein KA116_11545 [Proteobacteria bacterium]|nr:hypothetical protein [Pseudomonadota bacterium]